MLEVLNPNHSELHFTCFILRKPKALSTTIHCSLHFRTSATEESLAHANEVFLLHLRPACMPPGGGSDKHSVGVGYAVIRNMN